MGCGTLTHSSGRFIALESRTRYTIPMLEAGMNKEQHKRRYMVSGIDEDGDVQAFATDDRQSAEVRDHMERDLTDVRFTNAEGES